MRQRYSLIAGGYVDAPEEEEEDDLPSSRQKIRLLNTLDAKLTAAETECAALKVRVAELEQQLASERDGMEKERAVHAQHMEMLPKLLSAVESLKEEEISRGAPTNLTSSDDRRDVPSVPPAPDYWPMLQQLSAQIEGLKKVERRPSKIEFSLHRDGADIVRKITADIIH